MLKDTEYLTTGINSVLVFVNPNEEHKGSLLYENHHGQRESSNFKVPISRHEIDVAVGVAQEYDRNHPDREIRVIVFRR